MPLVSNNTGLTLTNVVIVPGKDILASYSQSENRAKGFTPSIHKAGEPVRGKIASVKLSLSKTNEESNEVILSIVSIKGNAIESSTLSRDGVIKDLFKGGSITLIADKVEVIKIMSCESVSNIIKDFGSEEEKQGSQAFLVKKLKPVATFKPTIKNNQPKIDDNVNTAIN